MTDHTITISESTYHSLIKEVQEKGLTVESWITSNLAAQDAGLPQSSSEILPKRSESFDAKGASLGKMDSSAGSDAEQFSIEDKPASLFEMLSGIIDSVGCESDVSVDSASGTLTSAIEKNDYFGEKLITDMKRQGLYFP